MELKWKIVSCLVCAFGATLVSIALNLCTRDSLLRRVSRRRTHRRVSRRREVLLFAFAESGALPKAKRQRRCESSPKAVRRRRRSEEIRRACCFLAPLFALSREMRSTACAVRLRRRTRDKACAS
jgi:hypothetical protein